ncbi:hypothetical protein DFH09DRAFT_1325110 [Mycena vulgaris]|nr:hypothetical protein DFH09DRAFT_1325110 [Mycena vulgaris]
MATLALSGTNILSLNNAIHTWDTSLLSAIVVSMPHLINLSLENLSPPDSARLQNFMSHLDAVVAALPDLSCLSIAQRRSQAPDLLDRSDLQREFNVVRKWGDISLTLASIRLSSEIL